MTWDAFKTKFRKAHMPSGLIKIMRDKFLNLKQGGMSVTDYLDKFTTWGRYAPNDIDTDEKKRERFLNGLQEELQTYLVGDIPNGYTSDVVLNEQARVAHQGGMADCLPGGPVAGETMAVLDVGAHGGSIDRPMAGCLVVHA
jgi:hypothetical protein